MSRSNVSSPKFRQMRLHNVELERRIKIQNVKETLKNNEHTYLLFSFKTDERQENNYVRDFQRQLVNTHSLGVMNIADLWSNKQINRYMEIQQFTKDKFLLSKLSRQRILYKMEQNNIPVQFHYEKTEHNKMSLEQIIDSVNIQHKDNLKLRKNMKKTGFRAHSEHF